MYASLSASSLWIPFSPQVVAAQLQNKTKQPTAKRDKSQDSLELSNNREGGLTLTQLAVGPQNWLQQQGGQVWNNANIPTPPSFEHMSMRRGPLQTSRIPNFRAADESEESDSPNASYRWPSPSLIINFSFSLRHWVTELLASPADVQSRGPLVWTLSQK